MNEEAARRIAPRPAHGAGSTPAASLRPWDMRQLLRTLVEPILHPSHWRIRALGLSTAVGHPLFYVIWVYALPQPYEDLWLRLAMSALGLSLLVVPGFTATPARGR